ncbi:MAG: MFS transporter [Rhodospirillales bacterium]|nr:MFS transporter [Rhodospirillales bacterium]MDE2199223.1 MFS transporter [Rhodospirillales bacterium]MDE2573695.1 MFS transporter [Rhodospirillales bacterium]
MEAPAVPIDHADASADAGAMPAFTHQQIVSVLTGILLCILLAAIDQTVVVPAVPAIAADLNGFDHLSWIISAYLITSTSAMPIYGKLSDIYGRRALLLPAIVVFVIASALCALSQTLFQLIAFRALQGLGGAGLMAMAQAAIADVVAPRERGRYQGYMAGTWGVASIFGPILGGWVTDHLSWHWIFWINLPIGAAAFYLSNRALKLLRVRRGVTRIDYAGAALLTGFITASLLLMSWGGNTYPWGSAPILGLGALSVGLLGALVVQERMAGEPLLPPRLFTNQVFSLGVVIAFLAAGGMFGATFLLPLFFQLIGGADASASGTLIVPFLGSNVLGAYTAGQLARRLGRAKVIVLSGLVAATAGFALLATMGPGTGGVASVLYMAVVGFGIGVCMPASLMIVQNAAERRDVGSATGALLFLRSMGGAFGSTLVGALLAGRFSARLAEAGVTRRIDLGALRGPQGGLGALDAATQAKAQAALASGFHLAFAVCAALAALALVACARMRDLPLKSGKG